MSPYIVIDEYLDTVGSPTCPPLYEEIALRNIKRLRDSGQITTEEFHHYCKRLTDTLERRPGRAK